MRFAPIWSLSCCCCLEGNRIFIPADMSVCHCDHFLFLLHLADCHRTFRVADGKSCKNRPSIKVVVWWAASEKPKSARGLFKFARDILPSAGPLVNNRPRRLGGSSIPRPDWITSPPVDKNSSKKMIFSFIWTFLSNRSDRPIPSVWYHQTNKWKGGSKEVCATCSLSNNVTWFVCL